jgi:hypothetical protein
VKGRWRGSSSSKVPVRSGLEHAGAAAELARGSRGGGGGGSSGCHHGRAGRHRHGHCSSWHGNSELRRSETGASDGTSDWEAGGEAMALVLRRR